MSRSGFGRNAAENEPERVGVSVARVVRQLGWAPSTAGVSVIADWERIVGPSIAANARAVASEGTTLVVSVDDPAWATQLHWLEADLLARLAAETGVQFERLAIRVRPRRGRSGSPR
ncbi:MAG: DciA family protein [Acidimicrobiales bacterium]